MRRAGQALAVAATLDHAGALCGFRRRHSVGL